MLTTLIDSYLNPSSYKQAIKKRIEVGVLSRSLPIPLSKLEEECKGELFEIASSYSRQVLGGALIATSGMSVFSEQPLASLEYSTGLTTLGVAVIAAGCAHMARSVRLMENAVSTIYLR